MISTSNSDSPGASPKEEIIINNDLIGPKDFESKADAHSRTTIENGSTEDESSKEEFVITSRNADVTLAFLLEHDDEIPLITPAEEKTLSRKVICYVVGLTAAINFVTYIDKAQLSYSTMLGFLEDIDMSLTRYNNVNTLFYVGYIFGQFNLLVIQRYSIRIIVIVLLIIWCAIMMLQCAVTNYKAVYALRLCLGLAEATIIPALNNTMMMFLTDVEKAATAPIFCIAMVCVSIPMGLISWAILQIDDPVIPHWKILSLIIGTFTFVVAGLALCIYPNNPTDAKFLSLKEKIWVIRRVQESTGSSIEQKRIKKYQIIETIKDPISWLFAFFFLNHQLANNLSYQRNLLLKNAAHMSEMRASLVSSSSGGLAVLGAIIASIVMFKRKNSTGYSVVFWSLPSMLACIVMLAIPDGHDVVMIVMICLGSSVDGITFMLMISWSTCSASGYTKRLTRIGMVMVGYSIANLISPQLWQESHAPRYYPAWAVQLALSFTLAPLIALTIRITLARRNKHRLQNNTHKMGAVELENGVVKTNLAMLDLTDLENKHFIYPL